MASHGTHFNNNKEMKKRKINHTDLSTLFRGLSTNSTDELSETGPLILLHNIITFLSYDEMHRLMMVNKSLNTILPPRTFKSYGGCILNGNTLKFDLARPNFMSSPFNVAGGVIGTHAFSDSSRNELRLTIPSNTAHCSLRIGITRQRPNMSDYEVIETDEEGEETVIEEGGTCYGIPFEQRQQFLQQLHNNRNSTEIHDIRIPERFMNANGYENDIHTIYHIVTICRDQIIIEDNYTITGNRASIGGRIGDGIVYTITGNRASIGGGIGDGTTKFERRDENETRRDVTIRMQYTSSQIHNDMFATDYAFTTELDNDSPNQGFVVRESPNRRMDGEYVWFVELGPNRPTPKAVGSAFVRIDGL